ncbi:MAG: hypothetical protein IT342_11510 [Candidatus Melainabacteria bacterium]|nr:hypothetical protein [Candidatus Melainabacteria bacterium]
MSTNPYYRYMLNVAGVREKEPFFQRAWGKVNILSRQRDRKIFQDLRATNYELQNSHNKKVLNSFNSTTIEHDHAALLEDLANETLIFLEEEERHSRERAKEQMLKGNAIHAYIAKIVETLSPYAGLVNTAVGHTELYTVLTGPEIIVEQIKLPGAHDSFEYRKDYRARFSTRTWSLLFRGVEGRLDVFLLPVDKVMRLTKVESFYKPVARIFAEVQGNKVVWTLDGEEKDAGERMSFILNLFHQLLERTKSQMFKERSLAGGLSVELLDLAIAKVSFDEKDDTMNFDYREGQPALFGANESANSSSAVEPAYVEEEIVEKQVIELTDFNKVTPEFVSQYLLTESDFATRTQDCLDKVCEASFKAKHAGPVDERAKKTAKTVKATKKSRTKTAKARSNRKK